MAKQRYHENALYAAVKIQDLRKSEKETDY